MFYHESWPMGVDTFIWQVVSVWRGQNIMAEMKGKHIIHLESCNPFPAVAMDKFKHLTRILHISFYKQVFSWPIIIIFLGGAVDKSH